LNFIWTEAHKKKKAPRFCAFAVLQNPEAAAVGFFIYATAIVAVEFSTLRS
jgi:hypothetical protein